MAEIELKEPTVLLILKDHPSIYVSLAEAKDLYRKLHELFWTLQT